MDECEKLIGRLTVRIADINSRLRVAQKYRFGKEGYERIILDNEVFFLRDSQCVLETLLKHAIEVHESIKNHQEANARETEAESYLGDNVYAKWHNDNLFISLGEPYPHGSCEIVIKESTLENLNDFADRYFEK